jgi:hypothetical protein
MHLFEKKNQLLSEIRYGLPSRRMLEVVSVGAFEFNGKMVIVKCRYEDRDLDRKIQESPFVTYDKYPDRLDFDYKPLLSQNVIFHRGLLGRSGLLALMELVELMNNDVIVAYSGSYYEREKI